jgi:alpha-methylacyl-CoA racemase
VGPDPGRALITGGSPRYQIYRTRDDRFIAAAPLEEKFWQNFCDAIGLSATARDDARDPDGVRRTAADLIRGRTAGEWRERFAGKDVCCSVVGSIREAVADPHLVARRLFERRLAADGKAINALPLPIAAAFRAAGNTAGYPALGEANSLFDAKGS